MLKKEFTIINKLGLHARAASSLVKIANAFEADVHIGKDELQVNGKSIMGVLLLAASQGSTIQVETNGPDEEQALAAVGELISNGFGELEE
ncbi:MAG TPA: HPr family phosphocarrier protein [Proteobacteria bacterium]|nr:MAG: HPr family phosphocarrier protein [Deltaproteobacteria bacterium]HDJ27971.1 HPr family phosphocarrier protein [Pseudomonadota bacterium]